MTKEEQKQYQINFLEENLESLLEAARKNYKRQGRGHLMFVCHKGNGLPPGIKVGDCWYVTEAKNLSLPDPDVRIETYVRVYDPETDAVVALYTGKMYRTFLIHVPQHGSEAIAA